MYPILFIHSSFDGLPCPEYCKCCCKNIGVPVSFKIMVFSGYRPKSRNTMVVLLSDFYRTSTLFSLVAASVYIPTTSSPTLIFCRFLGDGHFD